jgi:hypothetical protein
VLQLLDQFQRSSTHLAVVTDEYGEIEGITTPIDILKAIAGELPELGSRERPEALQREDGSWLVDGHLPIEELQRRLNRRDMVGRDYHTVAGFVLAPPRPHSEGRRHADLARPERSRSSTWTACGSTRSCCRRIGVWVRLQPDTASFC